MRTSSAGGQASTACLQATKMSCTMALLKRHALSAVRVYTGRAKTESWHRRAHGRCWVGMRQQWWEGWWGHTSVLGWREQGWGIGTGRMVGGGMPPSSGIGKTEEEGEERAWEGLWGHASVLRCWGAREEDGRGGWWGGLVVVGNRVNPSSWKAGGWHWRAGRGTCSSATVCTYEATVHGKYGLINIEKAPGTRSHRSS